MTTPEQQERLNQVTATLNAMAGCWPTVAAELARIRADKVETLVAADSPELRGAIKEIDQLLQLPNNLRQELLSYDKALSDQDAEA